jgi:hypothetical protein
MARKKKTTRKKTKTTNETALTAFDAELAALAKQYAEQEANVGGGSFIRLSGGIMSYQDAPIPGNTISVIILDSVHENVYYPDAYDPGEITSPQCFAFGRSDEEMKPHENSIESQDTACELCELNEFGTDARGKGKACKNRRRLAVIKAGHFTDDDEWAPYEDGDLDKAEIAFLGVPPTSVKPYAAYVKGLANGPMARAPLQVVTRISVVPDERVQFKLAFEEVALLDQSEVKEMLQRRKEASEQIEQPYQKPTEGNGKPKRKKKTTRRSKKTAKKTTKRAAKKTRKTTRRSSSANF